MGAECCRCSLPWVSNVVNTASPRRRVLWVQPPLGVVYCGHSLHWSRVLWEQPPPGFVACSYSPSVKCCG